MDRMHGSLAARGLQALQIRLEEHRRPATHPRKDATAPTSTPAPPTTSLLKYHECNPPSAARTWPGSALLTAALHSASSSISL